MAPVDESSLDLSLQPPPVDEPPTRHTPHRRLCRDVIAWVREVEGLHSEVLPEHELPPRNGCSDFVGELLPASGRLGLGYSGFVVAVSSFVVSPVLERAGVQVASLLLVLGLSVATLLFALSVRQRRRAARAVRVVVFEGTDWITPGQFALAFRADGEPPRKADSWAFAAVGFTADALAAAGATGVRCLVMREGTFVPAEPPREPPLHVAA